MDSVWIVFNNGVLCSVFADEIVAKIYAKNVGDALSSVGIKFKLTVEEEKVYSQVSYRG